MNEEVVKPQHYDLMGVEAIQVIARTMTEEQFFGFCLGNVLKYRLRAGHKGPSQVDLDKANYYENLYQTNKGLCISSN